MRKGIRKGGVVGEKIRVDRAAELRLVLEYDEMLYEPQTNRQEDTRLLEVYMSDIIL